MSKEKLSDQDCIDAGLLERVEGELDKWGYCVTTPSWVYQYMFQCRVKSMASNPLTTERFAIWLRYKHPEIAVTLGLADSVKFTAWNSGTTIYGYLDLTGAQYRDDSNQNRIALDHPNCPPSMIEYAMVRFEHRINYVSMSISSDVYLGRDFSEWVRNRDQRLASTLRLGERRAVRLNDEERLQVPAA